MTICHQLTICITNKALLIFAELLKLFVIKLFVDSCVIHLDISFQTIILYTLIILKVWLLYSVIRRHWAFAKGFEPSAQFPVLRLSRTAPSTTRSRKQKVGRAGLEPAMSQTTDLQSAAMATMRPAHMASVRFELNICSLRGYRPYRLDEEVFVWFQRDSNPAFQAWKACVLTD